MTDRLWIGAVLALLVEARHWTSLRWEFDDDACGRAWQFTSIATVLATVLIWMEGTRYTALPVLLTWMPVLLMPMQFVQSYGLRDSLPLSSFSYLARRHRSRNERLGLTVETIHFNFGNLLFAAIIVGATVGGKADSWFFLPSVVFLTGWALLTAGRCRPALVVPMLVAAGLLAVVGQMGLSRLAEWVSGRYYSGRGRYDANHSNTMIGVSGKVEQSPEIVWRLRPQEKTSPPRLLRTATFTLFSGSSWYNQRTSSEFDEADFGVIDKRDCYLLLPAETAAKIKGVPAFRIRGTVLTESPLALPGDALGLSGFEFDGVQLNRMGMVRVYPKQSVIEGAVIWKGGTNSEKPSTTEEDLRIPQTEREVIRATVRELRLADAPDLETKLSIIRNYFQNDFRYTRDLTIGRSGYGGKSETPIGKFLTKVKAGHCEYFATASALLLREAGIPARYATGYAVVERDAKRGEFVVRGTHGHAWCRVWDADAGLWMDFDATPMDWTGLAMPKVSSLQLINDGFKRVQEDFTIWRNRPANRMMASLVMISIGLSLAAFIIRRLWKSKRVLAADRNLGLWQGTVVRTPLHDVEKKAREIIGPRAAGTPFAVWLASLRGTISDDHLLDEAIALHQRLRFDPTPSPQALHERLGALAKRIDSDLKRRK